MDDLTATLLHIPLDTLWENTLTCEAMSGIDPDVSVLSFPIPMASLSLSDVKVKAVEDPL